MEFIKWRESANNNNDGETNIQIKLNNNNNILNKINVSLH